MCRESRGRGGLRRPHGDGPRLSRRSLSRQLSSAGRGGLKCSQIRVLHDRRADGAAHRRTGSTTGTLLDARGDRKLLTRIAVSELLIKLILPELRLRVRLSLRNDL